MAAFIIHRVLYQRLIWRGDPNLTITRQCKLLSIRRPTIHQAPPILTLSTGFTLSAAGADDQAAPSDWCTDITGITVQRRLRVSAGGHGQGDVAASPLSGLPLSSCLKEAGVAGFRGLPRRHLDNIFIARLWRSHKYEAVYLHELTDGFMAERVTGDWSGFYNTKRPHSPLGGQTSAEFYSDHRAVDKWTPAAPN